MNHFKILSDTNTKTEGDSFDGYSVTVSVNEMVSSFDHLPNELIELIFGYLSGLDIFCAFSNLTQRFTSLIQTYRFLQLDFSAQILSKQEFLDLLRQLRSVRIHSLQFSNRDYLDGLSLFNSYFSSTQFDHLRSLRLVDANENQLERCLRHCSNLKRLSLNSISWRSFRSDCLPRLSTLTHIHLPSLDLFNGSYPNLKHIALDRFISEDFVKLNHLATNLKSLSLVITRDSAISQTKSFPTQLHSLRLKVRSVIFDDLKIFLEQIDRLAILRVTILNSEYDVYPFDDYLSGENWFRICEKFQDFQFNVKIHRSQLREHPDELRKSFSWCKRRIYCESIEETNGYQIFSLPYIDSDYLSNSSVHCDETIDENDFDRVEHLHLFDSDELIHRRFPSLFRRLKKLTLIISNPNEYFSTLINNVLMRNIYLRCVELHLTTDEPNLQNFLENFLRCLPSRIDKLIFNQNCSMILMKILEEKDFVFTDVKRLECQVKTRTQLDTLLLFLLESLEKRRLIQLKICLETTSRLSNLLTGWMSTKTCLRNARTDYSVRHFSIWI